MLVQISENNEVNDNNEMQVILTFVMRCAVWYHLYNLKNVKNTHVGVLILGNFTKISTPPWMFFTFLNCTNGTKQRNAPHLFHV